MKPEELLKPSSHSLAGLMNWKVVLFLLIFANSVTGCALFSQRPNVVGTKRCPVMPEQAIQGWAEVYPQANQELRVWVGQIILHCEETDAMLD